MKRLFVLFLYLLLSNNVFGYTCESSINDSTPTNRFKILDQNTVFDSKTQLTWKRCTVGQAWVNNRCQGISQKFNWQDALNYAKNNRNGFRLPNIKELSSIVNRQCSLPSINNEVFNFSGSIWTSTPSSMDSSKAWSVTFTTGSSYPRIKHYKDAIILVK